MEYYQSKLIWDFDTLLFSVQYRIKMCGVKIIMIKLQSVCLFQFLRQFTEVRHQHTHVYEDEWTSLADFTQPVS